MRREFFGDAVYNTTIKEMDEDYPRCLKTKCDECYHTCMHYCHLADSDDSDPNAAWCTRKVEVNNLPKYRKDAGMSQRELAVASGVNLRTLQDYEQGRKPLGQAAAVTVHKIAKALGVTVEELIQ